MLPSTTRLEAAAAVEAVAEEVETEFTGRVAAAAGPPPEALAAAMRINCNQGHPCVAKCVKRRVEIREHAMKCVKHCEMRV